MWYDVVCNHMLTFNRRQYRDVIDAREHFRSLLDWIRQMLKQRNLVAASHHAVKLHDTPGQDE